ncbi:MAG TPA: PadR family transcriptional regulator [Polyangia bacterium]|jgi:transcriptional regulator
MRGQTLKGHLDAMLLASLARGPRHGYAIAEWLQARSDGELALATGTLYPALHRLEEDGLVRGSWHEPAGERRRRVYALTKKGERALAEQKDEWAAFSRVMNAVLGGAHG